MSRELLDLIKTKGDTNVRFALDLLPERILVNFNFNEGMGERRTKVYAKMLDEKVYGENIIQITLKNSHFGMGIFEGPYIKVPKGATDVCSIAPLAILDSLGGIQFKYEDHKYLFKYLIAGKGKDIVEENTALRYAREHNKVLVDEGTEIITRLKVKEN